MNPKMNDILISLDKGDFQKALEKCEGFVSECLASFMEELTINKATDFAGSTLLYAKICAMIKKPWKCIPKLESSQGALRFMEDFISDKSILSETFHSFAEAYERAGFLPEAINAYYKEAFYSESKDACLTALSTFFYYSEVIPKGKDYDLSFLKGKLSDKEIEKVKKGASAEAENRILTDPVEYSPEFLEARFDVENRVDEILWQTGDDPTPFCIRYWNTKKKVLKDLYSIDWKTPEEMNPQIRFY